MHSRFSLVLQDAASPQTDLGSACVSGVSAVGSAGLQRRPLEGQQSPPAPAGSCSSLLPLAAGAAGLRLSQVSVFLWNLLAA